MSDQDKISSCNINAESSGKVRRLKNKTQLEDYKLIQSQILLIEIISILWPTLGRIANEILGVKGLKYKRIAVTWNYQPFTCDNCLLSTSNWSEFWPFKQTVWLESHNPLISFRNYVFSGFGNGISRGWERKSISGRFATGRFWPCTWTISFHGKDQENSVYWKVGPLFVFVVIQRMCSSWVRRRTFRSLCGDSRSFYFHL